MVRDKDLETVRKWWVQDLLCRRWWLWWWWWWSTCGMLWKKYHPAMKWYQMVRCKMIRNNCVQIHCAICCLGLGMLHGIPFDFEFEWWHCVLSHCFHHSLRAERHVYAQQHWDVFLLYFWIPFPILGWTGCSSPTDSTGSESNWPSLIGMGRYCLLDTLHWHVKGFSWIFWLQTHLKQNNNKDISDNIP